MTRVLEAINHPLLLQLGWVLLHFLWQGTLVGALFALARLALRHGSANARYLSGVLTLIILFLCPVLTFVEGPPDTTRRAPVAANDDQTDPISQFATTAIDTRDSVLALGVSSLVQSCAGFCAQIAPGFTALWLTGVFVFSCRVTRSWFLIRTLRSQTEPLDPAWLEILADLRCRLEICRPVQLMKSTLVEVPTVLGWFRPVIFIPVETITGLTPEQLESILAHELAHIRRHDYLVNIFQCLVETLLFYHPVVWWVSHHIREEREHCCDDLVVKVCSNRFVYARALAVLEESRVGLNQLAFTATGGSLFKRIRRLLGLPETEASSARQLGGLALLAIGLFFIILGAWLTLRPPVFSATARVQMAPAFSALGNSGTGRFNRYDPYFVQTEFELLKSDAVLSAAARNLDLNTKWAAERGLSNPLPIFETTSLLSHRLQLRPVRNTSILEITATSADPKEAVSLANAVVEAYREHRQNERNETISGSVKALELRANEQQVKIRDTQDEVHRLEKQFNISYSEAEEGKPLAALSAETLRKIEEMRLEIGAQYAREEALLNTLKSLNSDQLIQCLPTAAPDALFTSLLEQLILSQQRLTAARSDFGSTHPEFTKASLQTDDLNKRVQARAEGILIGLMQRVEALKASLQTLQKSVDEAKIHDVNRAREIRPYLEAKNQLDELKRFQHVLNAKIASEQIDSTLPESTVIPVIDRAKPPLRPVSTDSSKAVVLVLFGLVLNASGVLLLKPGKV